MKHIDIRLKALEDRAQRRAPVCHVVDVSDCDTQEARQRINEQRLALQHSGTTAPLVIIDF